MKRNCCRPMTRRNELETTPIARAQACWQLNPAPSESNQETLFIPTEEEKEAITMRTILCHPLIPRSFPLQ